MNKITLITGGTRSGKSAFGEKLLEQEDEVLYIATALVTDKEMEERVRQHKARRNVMWSTYEGYKNIAKAIQTSPKKYIFLECVGTMISNILFEEYSDVDAMTKENIRQFEQKMKDSFSEIIRSVRASNKEAIIITNEVGYSLVSPYKSGRIFTDVIGRINQMLGECCDEVYLLACGLPMRLK